jgi:hypothetical protein
MHIGVFKLEEGQRVSFEKIRAMGEYLKRKGYPLQIFKELNSSNWTVRLKNTVYKFTENYQVLNLLKPLVDEEQDKDYRNYLKRREERLRDGSQ